jgi:hypothetical protein
MLACGVVGAEKLEAGLTSLATKTGADQAATHDHTLLPRHPLLSPYLSLLDGTKFPSII